MNGRTSVIRLNFVILIIIVLTGFYFRYISVYETFVIRIFQSDAKEYFSYAYNLRHKHIYSKDDGYLKNLEGPVVPDAMRNPGYPIFLSLFISGKPTNAIISRILFAQLIISVLSLILFYLLYQNNLPLIFTAIASSMVVICPHLIVANSYLLTETLFCFLIIALALTVNIFVKKPSFLYIFLVGTIMGLANLVRPSLLYFIFLTVIFLIFHYKRQKCIKYCIIMILGFFLVYSPWIVRNFKTLGIMIDKRLMINFLHHGIYPDFKFRGIKKSYGYPYRFDPNSKNIGKSVSSVINEITERFTKEPEKHMKWYFLKKPLAYWSWDNVQGKYIFVYPVLRSPYFSRILFKVTYVIMKYTHWIIILFGAFGMLFVWLPGNKANLQNQSILTARFISLLLIYYTIIHMIGFPLPRYSIPLRPFMYGMSFFALFYIYKWTKIKIKT